MRSMTTPTSPPSASRYRPMMTRRTRRRTLSSASSTSSACCSESRVMDPSAFRWPACGLRCPRNAKSSIHPAPMSPWSYDDCYVEADGTPRRSGARDRLLHGGEPRVRRQHLRLVVDDVADDDVGIAHRRELAELLRHGVHRAIHRRVRRETA